jgi:TRAP-type transport system periplasmic protein
MKKIIVTTAMVLFAYSVSAASVNVALDTDPDRENSGTYRYADNLIQLLKKKGWQAHAFPRDTIGGEDERLDRVRSGTLDISLSRYTSAAELVPEMQVLQLPYTFESSDHQYNFFVESNYLDDVNKRLASEGLRVLAVIPTGGFLGLFNSEKPIKTVSDMAGLRMRALDQNQLNMFEMMGASGVIIPLSEVSNAFKTGIADGYINASSVPLMFGQTDLLHYFTDAKVIMSARLALASQYWWDNLSVDEQRQFTALSIEAQKDVFDWVSLSETVHKQSLMAAGIEVYEPTEEDLSTFKSALSGMNQYVKGVSPDRVLQLQDMVSDYLPQ